MLPAPWASRVSVDAAEGIFVDGFQLSLYDLSSSAQVLLVSSWAGTRRSPRCHTNVIMLLFALHTAHTSLLHDLYQGYMCGSLLPQICCQEVTAYCCSGWICCNTFLSRRRVVERLSASELLSPGHAIER
jgi:hypothetical protein